METFIYLTVAAVGLLFGSFTNVMIARIPAGESIVAPPSHCPQCGHRLGAMDLVPVLSWLFLRRKCRYCRGSISSRYPLVEILTAALFAGVYWRWGMSAETLAGWILVIILVSTAFNHNTRGRFFCVIRQRVRFSCVANEGEKFTLSLR